MIACRNRAWGLAVYGLAFKLTLDNGIQNRNCYSIWGLYRDNGKENGNCYLGFGVWGLRFSD